MQFFAVVLAFAAAAMAAPSRHAYHSGEECSASGNTQVCCNGALNCVATVAADNCKNEAYCCDGGHSAGLLVNINALNCVKLL